MGTCWSCKFWAVKGDRRQATDESEAECRFMPPSILRSIVTPRGERALRRSWPETFGKDWCGQHQPAGSEWTSRGLRLASRLPL